MKKEYVIFLILVICSAMVCGSTLVITNNLSYLAESSKSAQLAAQEKADQPVANVAKESQSGVQNANRVQAATLVVASSESKSAEKVMLITPAEQEEIENMLVSLGANNQSDYSQLIKDFQSQHSLSPTGSMDTSTLNEIIRQVAKFRSSEAVS